MKSPVGPGTPVSYVVWRKLQTALAAGENRVSFNMTFNSFFLFIIFVCVAASCINTNRKELSLKQSSFDKVDEIDTIEAFPENGVYILQFIRNGALGHFSMHLAFEKQLNQKHGVKLLYESDNKSHFRISKDFIALVDIGMGETNWGWFQLSNGAIVKSLPMADKIEDSLKAANKEYFIRMSSGYYLFYDKGQRIKTLNYGNFITKHRDLNFDSLDYHLYKVSGDSLIIASRDVNDLFKQNNGVYFVPKPGFGVMSKYSKQALLLLLDSVSKLSSPPAHLFLKGVP